MRRKRVAALYCYDGQGYPTRNVICYIMRLTLHTCINTHEQSADDLFKYRPPLKEKKCAGEYFIIFCGSTEFLFDKRFFLMNIASAEKVKSSIIIIILHAHPTPKIVYVCLVKVCAGVGGNVSTKLHVRYN